MASFAHSLIGTQEGGFLLLAEDPNFELNYHMTDPNLVQEDTEQAYPLGTEYHRMGQSFRYIKAGAAFFSNEALEISDLTSLAINSTLVPSRSVFNTVKKTQGASSVCVGVACASLDANSYGWMCFRGFMDCEIAGSTAIGAALTVGGSTNKGELVAYNADEVNQYVGILMKAVVTASTGAPVLLQL